MLPKAARMESFEDDRNDSSAATNTVPHIIVACPSCSTKFAVESSLVAAVEDPQFHCSRCDQVFSLDEVSTVLHRDLTGRDSPASAHDNASEDGTQERSPNNSETRASTEPAYVETNEQRGRHTNAFSTPAPYNPPSQAHGTTASALGSTNTIPAPIRASDFSVASTSHLQSPTEGLPPFTTEQKPLQEEFTPTQTLNAGAHYSSPSSSPTSSHTNTGWVILPEEITSQISSRGTDLNSKQLNSSLQTVESETTLVSTEPPAAANLPPAVKPNLITAPAPVVDGSKRAAATSQISKGVQQELQFNRAHNSSELTRMQSLALAAAPLFIVLAALFIGSYSIRLSPDTLGAAVTKVTSIFGGVSPVLPPVELTVSKVSLKGVRIASKELVPVVTGVLTNRSQFTADGVTLEALGFDGRGELLISAQAPLRSALGREKLSELSLDTLKKFQRSLGARSALIKPGEEVPFTIALIPDGSREDQPSLADINLSQLKYFSARVFAVTSTSGQ
jgi:predicted Zn finger-like uncharacterized protein